MHVRENRAKQILATGGTIYTSSVRTTDPALCEILGYAGFDFVLLDGEHGAIDASSADGLVQGCHAGGTTPIVRVLRNNDAEAVMNFLDLGAQGILIPHCRNVDDARALQNASFYPPKGIRGFGPGRGIGWGRVPSDEYFDTINDTLLLLALIEDIEGVDNIDEIAAAGLDVLWIGTGDLTLDYGIPGERDHPKIKEAAQRILDACQTHGIVAGYPARNAEDAMWAHDQGFRAIGFGCAEQYIMQHSRQFLDAVER